MKTALLLSLLFTCATATCSIALGLAPARSWMTTPKPRPGDWMTRHQGFVAQAHAGGIDVVFLGDSITDGWRNTGLAAWKQHFAPLKAANFGIAGDGTQNVLWRITNGELDGFEAKVVVLLIGTNNIPNTFEGTTQAAEAGMVTEAITLLVSTIRAKQPNAKILLQAILPRGEWENPGRACIRMVNAKLPALESDHLRLVDLGHLFLDGAHITHDVMSDFLHPTGKAYGFWGPALAPAVKDLLRQD